MRSSLADIVAALGAKPCAGGFLGRCPAHDDHSPSLSITERGGRLLFSCHAGCPYEEVAAALEARGLTIRERREERNDDLQAWTIRDASGRALAQHVRADRPDGSKVVFWRGPNGEKARLSELGLKLVELPLYGSELLPDRPGEPVVITEGEKAADAACRLGLLALGTTTGASLAPSPGALASLRDRDTILWPDNDDEGARHMARVARNLQGIATTVRTVVWLDAPPKGDAADFVSRGCKRSDFDALPEPVSAQEEMPAALKYIHEATGESIDELTRFAAGDTSRYVPTGVASLDRALGGGLRRGQVTLIGAPTGAGKTTILGGFAIAAASRGEALIVSPEMSTAELAEREIVRRSGVAKWALAPWKAAGERSYAASAHAQAAETLQAEHPRVLILDRLGVTMDEVDVVCEWVTRNRGSISSVAIDYAQEIADLDPRAPRYLTVGAVAQRSVELARRLDVAVVIASQVNVTKGRTGPASYSFRETQVLEHKSSNVLLFVVDWQTDAFSGRRIVERAAFRATKCRGGSLFEVEVCYQPALFRVGDLHAEPVPERPTSKSPTPEPEALKLFGRPSTGAQESELGPGSAAGELFE